MRIGDIEVNYLSDKIKKENIFIGNIKRCTKYREVDTLANNGQSNYVVYKSEIVYKDVIFVKVCDNPIGYMILDSFEGLVEYLNESRIKEIKKENLNELIFGTVVTGLGSTWVDNVSIRPYYKNEKGKVKVKKVDKKHKKRTLK